MGIIIDFITIIILLMCIFYGYKRGLVNLVISLFTFVIALVIAIFLYKPIANIVIDNTSICDNIENCIFERIKDENVEKSDNEIIQLADKYILKDAKSETAEVIASSIAKTVIDVLTFIILVTVIRICLIIINKIFSIITEVPIIKQFNKLGGGLYGIIQGIIINYILFAVIIVIIPLISTNTTTVVDSINDSKFGSILYNENVIIKLINKN